MTDFLRSIYERMFADPGPWLAGLGNLVAILAVAAVAWWIFNAVIGRLGRAQRVQPLLEEGGAVLALIRRAGHYLILLLAGAAVVRLFRAPLVERLFYAFMILLLCALARNLVGHLFPYLERKLARKTDTRVDDVILDLFKKFAGVIIYTTGIILALDVIGLNIMPFVAGAGVAGIAIGFAARDTLSNLIAGVLLIIDRPFEVGDRIEIWSAPKNSATWGDVLDIGLRATKIRTTDHIVVIIPNNEIMKRDIINYTAINEEIRVRIPVGIAYDANVGKAKELINRIALELDWVMREPAPKVVVKSFGDSAVNLEARVWIRDPRRRMDTISHVADRVKEVFQEEGIEIPYPKRDITIRQA